jgi:hypothetical protein
VGLPRWPPGIRPVRVAHKPGVFEGEVELGAHLYCQLIAGRSARWSRRSVQLRRGLLLGQRKQQPGPDARLAARRRADILDVDRIWRERHDARAAGQNPSAFLVKGARAMIFGERPEPRLLNIRFA